MVGLQIAKENITKDGINVDGVEYNVNDITDHMRSIEEVVERLNMATIHADGVYTDHAEVPIRRMVDKNQRCLKSFMGDAYGRLLMWVHDRALLLKPDAAQRGLCGLSVVDDVPHRKRCTAFQERWGFLRPNLHHFVTDVMYLALATDTAYYNDLPSFISFVASSQLEATVGHFCTRVFGKDEHATGAIVCTVMTLCLIEVIEAQAVTKVPDPNTRRPDLDATAKQLAEGAYKQIARDTAFAESVNDKNVDECVLPLMQFSELTRTKLCCALSHVCQHARRPRPMATDGDLTADASELMSDFKAVAVAGVTHEQWQRLLDFWLKGEPKPSPWLQCALDAFSSQLRDVRKYADEWQTSAMLIEKENGRMAPIHEAKEVLTDEEASTLALKITSYPKKRHVRLQRAMELAITLYALSRKENGGPMEYSNNPEDREIRSDVKKRTESLKKAKGTPEDLGIMAGSYLVLKGKAHVYVSTAMEVRWREWIRTMCVALGADAEALADDEVLSCAGLKKEEPSSEKWRSPLRMPGNHGMALHQVQKQLNIDQLPDNFERGPSYVSKFDLPLRDDDELTSALPGDLPFDKLAHWVSKTSDKMPVAFRDSMRAFTVHDVVALLQLLLQTKSDKYHDLNSLLAYIDEEDHRKLQTWLITHVFKKKASAASIGRVLDMYRKFSAWVVQACKQVNAEGTKTTAPQVCELSHCKPNEAHWDYAGEAVRSCAAAWFVEVRKLNPRPARIKSLKSWEGGRPFMRDDEAPRQLAPCWGASEFLYKHTMNDQVLMMEIGGAEAWLQPQFHPLANWESYVALLIRREKFQSKESCRTNTATAAYKLDMESIGLCHSAIVCNDPTLFRQNMGVLSEATFKTEYAFDCAAENRTLSARLGYMLTKSIKLNDSDLEGAWGVWKDMDHKSLVHHPLLWGWVSIINELAAKRDHVATMVVDVIGVRLNTAVNDAPIYSLLFDPAFADCPVDVRTLKFTDHTAPLMLRSYWEAHPGSSTIRQLQASVRQCCFGKPRLRFPGTAFCEAVQHTTASFLSWSKHTNLSLPSLDLSLADGNTDCRVALQKGIDTHHCKLWRMAEMVWGGCALIRYAQSLRAIYELATFDEPPTTDLSLNARYARWTWEALFNLDQAELLLTVALETGSMETDGGMVTGHSKDTSHARKFLREARELRSKWKQAHSKREQQRTLLIRKNAQKAEAKQRQLEIARHEIVSACVQGAIGNVLQAARAHDAAEKQRKADEERAEAARLAKEERRRKEEHRAMLVRVIQINREAAERREAHLAKRAVIEKKAAEREKREAVEAAKKLRSQQWEAERAKHKAEEEERMVRFQQEAEAERRERERRRAEEEARASAAALAAERERVASVERARREKEEEAVRQREEAALQRALQESEATRVRDEPVDAMVQHLYDLRLKSSGPNAYYRDGVPLDLELERRTDQSRFDRLVVPKVDAFRQAKKRTALTKAFGWWRSLAELRREAARTRACGKIKTVQATLKAGTSEKWADQVEADKQQQIQHRLMQQRVDRMHNKNLILQRRAALVEAMRLWRLAAERVREWNGPRSRNGLEEFTFQRRCQRRARDIVEHWKTEGRSEAERWEATIDRDMLAKAATAYFTSKKGDRFAVAEDLTRKTHYWYNKCCMSKALHSWCDAARALKAKKDGKKLAEARRATQEHCNAIFRENMKQREEAEATHNANVERGREARLQADKAAEAAMTAELAKAQAEHTRPSWDVLRFAERQAAMKALEDEEAKAASRRATQERCNAIMRENRERIEQAKKTNTWSEADNKWVEPAFDRAVGRKSPPSRESPPPPPPLPPSPESPPPLLSPTSPPMPRQEQTVPAPAHALVVEAACSQFNDQSQGQWHRDYRKELARVQADSKMQWDTGTGWAAGAHTLWHAFGGQDYVNARVRERQQWDAQCATFWANSRHMDRVRQRQREAVDDANRRELKAAADKFLAQLEDKKAEHGIAMHAQMEAWKRALQAEQAMHEAKQRAAEADFQAKLDTISGQNASLDAFEAENHTLLRERANLFCGRLRARLRAHEPNAATSRLAPKHECVVCFDATCTHVATTCGHVIGCGACCASLTSCPICCATTHFVELRFPH